MPIGISANSPIDGDTAPLNVSNNESGDEGPRKRSASPETANQSAWGDNPAKKICTEGIDQWVQSTSDAAPPDISHAYQDNHDVLVSMGFVLTKILSGSIFKFNFRFKTDEIDAALRLSNNEMEKAVQYLTREITGLDAAPDPPPSSVESQKTPFRYRLERLEFKRIYAYLADVFVTALIPMIDSKIDVHSDERSLNIFSNFIRRDNDVILIKMETYVTKALDRFRIVNDKEIRDALIRRNGLDLLQEIVILCDRFDLDVASTTQAARLDYLRKWIRCPQMECILNALEELGTIADRFHRNGGLTITRPKSHVNEEFFKKWLEENKVLQIVLTGNMDHVVYVERIQPILQYMTPELTLDDMEFVWSLRKGRMGVSVENFNKIMEFISKSVNNEQIEWLIELFKKSFRSRETRLYESIFNFAYTIANQKEKDDECRLKICNIIWELINIARGPPRCSSFKAIEHGMKNIVIC
ncbi:hypothetical protein CAEBREN_28849, partial [Caenorhabditis brenneri]